MANAYMRDNTLATGIIEDGVDPTDSISIVERDSAAYHTLQTATYNDPLGRTKPRYEEVNYATWLLAGGTSESSHQASGPTGPTGATGVKGATGATGPTGP